MATMETFKKNKTWHPGAYLKTIMSDMRLSQKELAEKTGFSAAYINDLLNERRSVSVKMAISLSKIIDVPAKEWLSIQNDFDLQNEALL
jgi:antitoxin HigA-1